MAKITLTEPLSGYNLAAINANFVAIEQEFQDKVLYRNNPVGEPNALVTDIDANSKRIYNLPAPSLPSEAARLADIQNALSGGAANLITSAPAGGLAATNVQAALNELDTEKVRLDDLALSSGAALVGYMPSGAGTVPTTVQAKLRESVSITDKGASTASADNTLMIQAALDEAGIISFPDGEFITGPLSVRSGSTLILSPGTVLKAITGLGVNDRLLKLENITDVTIYGNHGVVQMLKTEYLTGEQRHCLNISGSSRISIYDLVAKDSGGDGFYVGGPVYCEDIKLIGCIAQNNRRQGLSITNVINCLVLGGHYKDTIGTLPACGIDVESNLLDGYYLQNVNIIGVRTSNNAGGGILLTPQSKFSPVSINVSNCTSQYDGDSSGGIGIKAAMGYTPTTDPSLIGKINGKINIKDCSIIYPQGSGVVSINWTENAPETLLENVYVLNPYSNPLVTSADRNKCGLLIRGETPSSGLYGTSIGNLNVKNFKVADNRTVPLMAIPIYLEPADEADKPLKYINIQGVKAKKTEWTSSSTTPILRSGTLASTDVVVNYGVDWIVAVGSFTPGTSAIGAIISTTTSSNFTLPLAALFIGSSFTFRHVNAGNLQISVDAGDVIDNHSPSAGIGLIARSVGAEITVKAVASGRWQVTNIVGGWGVNPYYGERIPATYNTAAPTAGTWAQGDIVFNKNAAASGFVGWVCTTAGTPGTWKTFGAISA